MGIRGINSNGKNTTKEILKRKGKTNTRHMSVITLSVKWYSMRK